MACSSCGQNKLNNGISGARVISGTPAPMSGNTPGRIINAHPAPYQTKPASGSVGQVRTINSAKIVRRTI